MEHDTGPGSDPAAQADGAGAGQVEPADTGEPRVDAALRSLGDLDGAPVAEHPPIFERIHGQLVEVLGELHSGADPAHPGSQGGQGRQDSQGGQAG